MLILKSLINKRIKYVFDIDKEYGKLELEEGKLRGGTQGKLFGTLAVSLINPKDEKKQQLTEILSNCCYGTDSKNNVDSFKEYLKRLDINVAKFYKNKIPDYEIHIHAIKEIDEFQTERRYVNDC